jgi:hypothetical protein
MEDSEEIFKEMKDVIDETYSIHAENFSSGNFSGNENIEVSSGVQSEKNCYVLVIPLVQSSTPTSSPKSSGAAPVSYFESLTPEEGQCIPLNGALDILNNNRGYNNPGDSNENNKSL